MKPLRVFFLLLSCFFLLSGCVTKNPAYQAGSNEPPYIVDARLNEWSNRVAVLAKGVAPLNPSAGVTDYAISAVFGLAAVLSGLWGRHKGKITNTMAAGVVKAGPQAISAVLAHASDGDKFGNVSAAINDNMGANQTIPPA